MGGDHFYPLVLRAAFCNRLEAMDIDQIIAAAISALAIWSCAAVTGPDAPQDKVFSLDREFTLDLGQTGRTADSSLVVRFANVPSESRCPPDVVCVWEGFAQVALTVETPDSDTEAVLSTNPAVCCTADTVGGYIFSLVGLAPVPRSDETNPAYVARLFVSGGG